MMSSVACKCLLKHLAVIDRPDLADLGVSESWPHATAQEHVTSNGVAGVQHLKEMIATPQGAQLKGNLFIVRGLFQIPAQAQGSTQGGLGSGCSQTPGSTPSTLSASAGPCILDHVLFSKHTLRNSCER